MVCLNGSGGVPRPAAGADVLVVVKNNTASPFDLAAAVSASVRPGGDVLLCTRGDASLDMLIAGLVEPVALGEGRAPATTGAQWWRASRPEWQAGSKAAFKPVSDPGRAQKQAWPHACR